MRENWVYRRGDVYLADCGAWRGSIQGGIRPVVVMQNNTGNRHSPTLSEVKLTSKVNKKPNQPSHPPLTKEALQQLEQNILEEGAIINLYRLILGLLVRPSR